MSLFDLPNISSSKISDNAILSKATKKVTKPLIKGGR